MMAMVNISFVMSQQDRKLPSCVVKFEPFLPVTAVSR